MLVVCHQYSQSAQTNFSCTDQKNQIRFSDLITDQSCNSFNKQDKKLQLFIILLVH